MGVELILGDRREAMEEQIVQKQICRYEGCSQFAVKDEACEQHGEQFWDEVCLCGHRRSWHRHSDWRRSWDKSQQCDYTGACEEWGCRCIAFYSGGGSDD